MSSLSRDNSLPVRRTGYEHHETALLTPEETPTTTPTAQLPMNLQASLKSSTLNLSQIPRSELNSLDNSVASMFSEMRDVCQNLNERLNTMEARQRLRDQSINSPEIQRIIEITVEAMVERGLSSAQAPTRSCGDSEILSSLNKIQAHLRRIESHTSVADSILAGDTTSVEGLLARNVDLRLATTERMLWELSERMTSSWNRSCSEISDIRNLLDSNFNQIPLLLQKLESQVFTLHEATGRNQNGLQELKGNISTVIVHILCLAKNIVDLQTSFHVVEDKIDRLGDLVSYNCEHISGRQDSTTPRVKVLCETSVMTDVSEYTIDQNFVQLSEPISPSDEEDDHSGLPNIHNGPRYRDLDPSVQFQEHSSSDSPPSSYELNLEINDCNGECHIPQRQHELRIPVDKPSDKAESAFPSPPPSAQTERSYPEIRREMSLASNDDHGISPNEMNAGTDLVDEVELGCQNQQIYRRPGSSLSMITPLALESENPAIWGDSEESEAPTGDNETVALEPSLLSQAVYNVPTTVDESYNTGSANREQRASPSPISSLTVTQDIVTQDVSLSEIDCESPLSELTEAVPSDNGSNESFDCGKEVEHMSKKSSVIKDSTCIVRQKSKSKHASQKRTSRRSAQGEDRNSDGDRVRKRRKLNRKYNRSDKDDGTNRRSRSKGVDDGDTSSRALEHAHDSAASTSYGAEILHACQWPEKADVNDLFNRQFMQCDTCDSSYHFRCVGVSKNDARRKDGVSFICPPCSYLDDPTKVIRCNQNVCLRPDCDWPGEASDDLEDHYVIEKLVGRGLDSSTQELIWLVKWEGYPAVRCTWSKTSDLLDADALIEQFNEDLKKQKLSNEDSKSAIFLKEAEVIRAMKEEWEWTL